MPAPKWKLSCARRGTAGWADAMPAYEVVEVGERKVLLGGFLTEDMSIYTPSIQEAVTIAPVTERCASLWDEAKAALGYTPDVFLPMTHQLVPQDRATAEAIAKHAELASRTPIILGGHEHELFIEDAGKSTVIKLGQDAERIGIVDIYWDAAGELHTALNYAHATEYAADGAAAKFVAAREGIVSQMMSAAIAKVPRDMDSLKPRFEASGVGTFLLSLVKRGLAKEGCELAMIQGGAVRGSSEYKEGAPFTMGDLFKEFAFDAHQALIPLKGSVIAESVLNTRSAPKPAPNFLQLDDGCEVSEAHELLSINGAPLEPERIYKVAIYQFLLTGLNVIEPLLGYVKEHVRVPSLEECRPVKDVVMEVCVKDSWRQLIGYEKFDANGDGNVSQDELEAGIDKVIQKMDHNGDGFISKGELERYLADIHGDAALLGKMIDILDVDGDGQLSRTEMRSLAI
jgi:2',3'-cyclic-nucleotide 2'-phosphodiesterase (5'-nucleotidase family)